MALSFLFLLVRRVIELLRIRRLSSFDKDVEILVLRHQLDVLRRKSPRPRFSWADRAILVLAARLLPRWRWSALLVTPVTVLDWQRKIVRRRWTYAHRPGRPALAQETVKLICQLARENPRWGYLRVVGELKKLGVSVSATAVRGVLRHHRLGPAPRRTGPSWRDFLRAQATSMLATDFFHVDTVLGQRFYCLFVIEVGSRVVRLLGATTNPDGRWMAQVARNLIFELQDAGCRVRFLVRDHDCKFTVAFDEILYTEGVRTVRTPVRAPRANCYAERWVETLRAECLDHLLVLSHRQLDVVLRAYVEHYNRARPHRGLRARGPRRTCHPAFGRARRTSRRPRRSHPRVPASGLTQSFRRHPNNALLGRWLLLDHGF